MAASTAKDAPVASCFDDVYETHIGFVWRTLAGLGVPEADLEDAVQEVFVVVHRRLDEFEGRSLMTTWLYAIARRIASDRARKRARRDRPLPPDLMKQSADDPRDAARRAEARRLLLELLGRLDADKREVFVLVELEQIPVRQVAAMLGLKLNTAWSRLRLARRSFEREVARHRARIREEQR